MRRVRGAKIPSANGHMSAQALATLMDAITTPNRILSAETIALAVTPQQCSGSFPDGDDSSSGSRSSAMLDNAQASFGLGFQIHELIRKEDGSVLRSLGHAGFGGSIVLSIPEADLTIAFTTNQLKLKSVARTRVLCTVLDELGLEPPKSLID